MKTFNGSKKLKKELLTKLKHHQDLDTFIQGTWLDEGSGKVEGNGFKGCFYGCTMQTDTDAIKKFSDKYNIDLWYCYLTERIYEGLPKEEFKTFPYKSIEVLPENFDINNIKSKFNYLNLENQLQYCKDNEEVTNTIRQCMELFKTPFDKIDKSAAESAAWSAWSARSAESAAWSAWSAESAAWSAWSAESAAWSAESAAESAWSVAGSNYYVFLRDLLFKCIKEFS